MSFMAILYMSALIGFAAITLFMLVDAVVDVLREPKRTVYDLAMTPAAVEDRRALILPFIGTERRDVQDDVEMPTPEQLRHLA